MRERPILFSAPMIRAILAGQKTQTRRVVKPQPPSECSIHYMLGAESWLPESERSPLRHHWEAWGGELFDNRPDGHLCGSHTVRCPYGAPGDRLWVRERHQRFDKGSCDQHVWYTAGRNDNSYVARTRPEIDQDAPWPRDAAGPAGGAVYGVPSIHMPRWASRILLEIVSVRVERLRDISEDDARSEGIKWGPAERHANHDPRWIQGLCRDCAHWNTNLGGNGGKRTSCGYKYDSDPAVVEPEHGDAGQGCSHGFAVGDGADESARFQFKHFWSHLNGAGSWEANPWVWVVEFNRVQA